MMEVQLLFIRILARDSHFGRLFLIALGRFSLQRPNVRIPNPPFALMADGSFLSPLLVIAHDLLRH